MDERVRKELDSLRLVGRLDEDIVERISASLLTSAEATTPVVVLGGGEGGAAGSPQVARPPAAAAPSSGVSSEVIRELETRFARQAEIHERIMRQNIELLTEVEALQKEVATLKSERAVWAAGRS
jgi:hypothetical protein